MGNNKKTPVVIDGVEHQYDDFTDEQKAFVNHISDLDRKIHNARFNLDQLNVGRAAFVNLLRSSLNKGV